MGCVIQVESRPDMTVFTFTVVPCGILWYLFHLLMKLSMQLVVHSKSVHPEANSSSINLGDCFTWLCSLFILTYMKCPCFPCP